MEGVTLSFTIPKYSSFWRLLKYVENPVERRGWKRVTLDKDAFASMSRPVDKPKKTDPLYPASSMSRWKAPAPNIPNPDPLVLNAGYKKAVRSSFPKKSIIRSGRLISSAQLAKPTRGLPMERTTAAGNSKGREI